MRSIGKTKLETEKRFPAGCCNVGQVRAESEVRNRKVDSLEGVLGQLISCS